MPMFPLATNNIKLVLKYTLKISMSLKKYRLIPILPGVCLIVSVNSEIAEFMKIFWQANCYEIWKKKNSSFFFPSF